MVSGISPVGKLRRREIFVLVAILVGLVVPLLASTWYSYGLQSEAREKARDAEVEYIVELLVGGMRDPVWNLTPESGRSLFESMLENQAVVAIRVTSVAQGDFLSGGNEVDGDNEAIFKLSRDINYENEKIGEISIVFDNSTSLQEAQGIWLGVVITLAVQISISAFLVFLLLRVFANLERDRVMRSMNQTLEESERNYRSLFENAAAGIGRTNLHDGKVIQANKKLANIFGYDDPEEFVSEFNFTDHYPEWDDGKQRLELYERNPGATLETVFTRRDGSIVFTESEVKVNKEQGFIDFVIIDISERHRAKTALKEIEHDYQALFDSANVGIGRTRIEDSKLLLANQKLADIFGYESPQKFITEYKFLQNKAEVGHREKIIGKLSGSPTQVVEESYRKRDGSVITVMVHDRFNSEAGWIDFVMIDITDLKLADRARREYEDLVNALINHSPVPVSVKDLNGNYIFISPAFNRYLEMAADEAIGKKLTDILEPDTAALLSRADETILKTGKPLEAADAFPVEIGSLTVQVNKFPILDESGTVTGIGTIGIDITEAVRTERELAEQTDLLQQAEAIANLGHWKWTEGHRRMILCSEQAARIFGRTVSDLLKSGNDYTTFIELIHQDDRNRVNESEQSYYQKFRDSEDQIDSMELEYRILLPDGSIRYLRETTEITVEGRDSAVYVLGTVQDVTERVIARDELRQHRDQLELLVEQRTKKLQESEELFRSFYEINPDIFMITEQDQGTCISVNDGFCRVTGYSREETVGRSTIELKLWKNERDRKKLVSRLRKDGYINNLSAEFRRKDGSCWPGLMAACSVQLDGKPHILSSTKDVSEMRKIQDAALYANNAKSEFLSSMSHELRTPLNAVLGFAQILRYDSKEPLSERQLESIDFIINSGDLLLKLINQVLELSKIEAGKLDLEIETVAPAIVIEECLSITRSMALPRSIEVINKAIDEDLPKIQTDLTRAKQVLLNLLSNAVKYNCDGGNITLNAESRSDKMLRLSVKDTGTGLTVEEQKRVFEPFDRLGQEATEIQGTGIGLAIAKNLIKSLGGNIGVHSDPGKGSTFWIDLPLSEFVESELNGLDELEDSTDFNLPLSADSSQRQILYIEDNSMNAQLMQTILEGRADLELVIAANAENGIELARSNVPDVILMDVGLPGMDGIEATRVLKKSTKTRHIPVIAISAAAMSDDVIKAKKAGVFEYVTKPIIIPDFLKVLRLALAESNEAAVG